MAEMNPDVMSMVEEELRKDPKISTDALFSKAQEIDPSIAELTSRQFFARYPLQVKRRGAPRQERKTAARRETGRRADRRRARRAKEAGVDRAAIRGVLLKFAKDIAAAEAKADVVEVIGDVDRYVDRIVKAAGAN